MNALALSCSPGDACWRVTTEGFVDRLRPETPPQRFAWPVWWGGRDVRAIGIEIARGGGPFPVLQLAGLCELCLDLIGRYGIPRGRIVGLGDLAPARSTDPGHGFPWADLAANGVGVWPDTPDLGLSDPWRDAARLATVRAALAAIGYGVAANGPHDAALEAVLRGFQRRFRPAAATGLADIGTRARIAAVAAALTPDDVTGM